MRDHRAADAMRILHITDTHLFADESASLRGRVTYASLQQVLRHIRQEGWEADLAMVTGDLIQDDTREAYENFRRLSSSLALPVHCVPGNHDIRPLMQEVLDGEPFHYCASIERDNWLVLGIDSCKEGSAAGCVGDSELERMDAIIRVSDSDHVMLGLHHPPLPVGSDWLDQVGLINGEAFLKAAQSSGKVRLVLFGHVHQAFEQSVNAISIIGTPSTCRQFTAGSANYDVDDSPPAYRRIELHPNGNFDSQLIRAVP